VIVDLKVQLADAGDLPACRAAAEKAAARAGFAGNDLGDVVSAIFEACVNAITHGRDDSGRPGTLRICVTDDRLEATIRDFGRGLRCITDDGFPPAGTARGRGIPLMKAFMDEVKLEHDGGSRITLVKYLPQGA
jgi:serine/threonine-protein kinase RsbW